MTAEEPEREPRWRTARRWIWDDPDKGQTTEERAPLKVGPRIKKPAARIHNGSAILGRRWGRWIWPEAEEQQSIPAALRRLAGTGGVAYLAGTAVLDSPALMWPAVTTWCVCAYRTVEAPVPEGEEEAVGADEDDTVDEPPPAPLPLPLGPDVFTEKVRGRLTGHRAVHLAELAEDIGTDIPTVRAMADAAGIPVRDTRSSTRTGSTVGIRADDLPDPSPDPERGQEPVVGAGQPDVNNNNTVTEEWAEGAWVTRDPAETAARHHAA